MALRRPHFQAKASTLFLMAGLLLRPNFCIGELFLRAIGLGHAHAFAISTIVGPFVLLLVLVCSLVYGGACVYQRRPAWQFVVEAVIAVVLLVFTPAY